MSLVKALEATAAADDDDDDTAVTASVVSISEYWE